MDGIVTCYPITLEVSTIGAIDDVVNSITSRSLEGYIIVVTINLVGVTLILASLTGSSNDVGLGQLSLNNEGNGSFNGIVALTIVGANGNGYIDVILAVSGTLNYERSINNFTVNDDQSLVTSGSYLLGGGVNNDINVTRS